MFHWLSLEQRDQFARYKGPLSTLTCQDLDGSRLEQKEEVETSKAGWLVLGSVLHKCEGRECNSQAGVFLMFL